MLTMYSTRCYAGNWNAKINKMFDLNEHKYLITFAKFHLCDQYAKSMMIVDRL